MEQNKKMSIEERRVALDALVKGGLTIGECIRALAAEDGNPYVDAARRQCNDDLKIDDESVISQGQGSAWVLCWMRVTDEEAGIFTRNSELLEHLFDIAKSALKKHQPQKSEAANQQHQEDEIYLDWLEDLISNYADELDEIEAEEIRGLPGSISWVTQTGEVVRFMPSSAIARLHLLARSNRSIRLEDRASEQLTKFTQRYGNKLDSILRAIDTANL